MPLPPYQVLAGSVDRATIDVLEMHQVFRSAARYITLSGFRLAPFSRGWLQLDSAQSAPLKSAPVLPYRSSNN